MTIAEIMTTKVICATMDDTLGGIRKVFEMNRCHHIPIIEDNRLVGLDKGKKGSIHRLGLQP